MWCRMSGGGLQTRQAGDLLDARDRNGARTGSRESVISADLRDTSGVHTTGAADEGDASSLHMDESPKAPA